MKRASKWAVTSTAMASLLLMNGAVSAAPVYDQSTTNTSTAHGHTQSIQPNSTSTYTGGDTPAQIKHAYGFDLLPETGAGQTIAVVDAYGSPTIAADLNTFDAQFGLPAANLTVAAPGGTPTTNGNWALETALDVEWAHAFAPQANLLLVEAKSTSYTDLLTAIDYATNHGASVVTMSWGGSETSSEGTYETHFEHSGVTYVATSGNSSTAEWPAASPNVLSVGGNTLTLDGNGNYLSETALAGLALSTYFSAPSYQSAYSSTIGAHRATPDVSLGNTSAGAAVYDSTADNGQTGWFQVAGASTATVGWGALIALADQQRSARFGSSNLMNDLYSLSGSTNYHVGGGSGPAGLLGSPIANVLVPNLITAP